MKEIIRNIPFGYPLLNNSEKKEIIKVLSGNILAHGPRTKNLKKNFVNLQKHLTL